MITFNSVAKTYKNGAQALKNINLHINKGEFVFLMGQSGAGKSTMIKMLIKEEVPTEGEIIVNNQNILEITKKKVPFYRRSIGIVFQDFRLLPNRTVYDNVAFALRILEMTPRAIRKKVPVILNMVGLSGKSKCYPHELSGGEQQRVAIARALVNNPAILICDEPTGNLDSQTSWEIMDILDDVNKKGTTIIMATHAQDIVDKMRKRLILLDRGIIVKDTGIRGEE